LQAAKPKVSSRWQLTVDTQIKRALIHEKLTQAAAGVAI
jgi:hypothetical protein